MKPKALFTFKNFAMAKTINPKMFVFSSLKTAVSFFKKLTVPAELLEGTRYSKDFFVEILTPGEKTAKECWPTHYTVLKTK